MGPSAWISWLLNDVQLKSPADPSWLPAKLEAPLEPLDRVRTLRASAAEVTFRALHRLRLGEDALLVINRRAKSSPNRRRIADVELQEGTLLARLADRRPLSLRSPAAEVELKSTRARIRHDAKTAASMVSVYEGRAKVAAEGAAVDVDKGFGTRVREGRRPEPPTVLPPPPAWVDAAPLVLLAGRSSTLAWRRSGSSASAVVEVLRNEAGTARLIRTLRAANQVEVDGLRPGLYRALVRGEDQRGLVGDRGEPRPIVVLATSQSADRSDSALANAERNVVRLAAPGTIELAIPDGVRLVSQVGSVQAGRWSVTLDEPGRFDLPFALEASSGGWRTNGQLAVVVAAPVVAPPPPPTAPRPVPSGLGVRAGASVAWGGGGAPTVWVDYGWPLRLDNKMYLRLGPETGWSQVAGASGSIQLIPLQLRAALTFDVGFDYLFLGGAGGVAVATGRREVDSGRADTDVLQPSWRVFVGLGQRLTQDFEGELELGYSRLILSGEERFEENQMMLLLGLRWLAP